jgi:hypothetical protein
MAAQISDEEATAKAANGIREGGSMKRIEIPRSVHLLAQFANLKPEEVDDFRKLSAEEDFAPDTWWSGTGFSMRDNRTIEIWQAEQKRLRDAWAAKPKPFPREAWLELIISSAKYSEREEWLRNYSEKMLQMNNEDAFRFSAQQMPTMPPVRVYSYYQAIVFVSHTPWCAKVCKRKECQKYFIADMNRKEFCSFDCLVYQRNLTKLASWNKPGGGRDQRKARMIKAKGGTRAKR